MRPYFDYWAKRMMNDGLKAIRLVIGLGLSVSFGYTINYLIGIMVFGYVLVDTLIDKN